MSKEIIKTNLKNTDKIELKYNDREVDMTLSDFKTYLDEVLEPESAVLTSTEPLRYKALLSQNTPIASQTSGTFIVGMIVSTTTYVAGDNFSNWTLISGTVNTTGAVYQVTVAAPTVWTNGSTLAYNGRPYVVSTDVNGDLNPFVNTLGETPILAYDSTGFVHISKTGGFDLAKTFPNIGTSYKQGTQDMQFKTYVYTDNKIWIDTASYFGGVATPSDGGLYYTPFEIEIYP